MLSVFDLLSTVLFTEGEADFLLFPKDFSIVKLVITAIPIEANNFWLVAHILQYAAILF